VTWVGDFHPYVLGRVDGPLDYDSAAAAAREAVGYRAPPLRSETWTSADSASVEDLGERVSLGGLIEPSTLVGCGGEVLKSVATAADREDDDRHRRLLCVGRRCSP
jgi:uncharacterized protein (DUF2342 family)